MLNVDDDNAGALAVGAAAEVAAEEVAMVSLLEAGAEEASGDVATELVCTGTAVDSWYIPSSKPPLPALLAPPPPTAGTDCEASPEPPTGTILLESVAGAEKAARLVDPPDCAFLFCVATPHFGPVTRPGVDPVPLRTNSPGFGTVASVDSVVVQSVAGTLATNIGGRDS